MPIVVVAMDQPDYDAWVNKTKAEAAKGPDLSDLSRDQLVSAGATVYEKNCATCHMPGGEGIPGAFPALKGSAVVTGDINKQAEMVLNGKGAMPAFGRMLKADELAQVITYTRNALGNTVGDEIQPKAVQALLPEGASTASDSDEEEDDDDKPAAVAETKTEAAKTNQPDPSSKEGLIAKGKTVYESHCVSCHQAGGQGLPPTFPALTDSDVVTGDIKEQVKLMKTGKGMMPAFGSSLSPAEFAAVVTYTRNALGNSVNDMITPEEIEALQ